VARPVKRATAINNSGLSLLKARLLGHIDKPFEKSFFLVGSEVHKRVLEPKKKHDKFEPKDERMIAGMVKALLSNAIMRGLLVGAIVEKKLRGYVDGVLMHGTLDINRVHDKNLIADIKTTSGKTQADCLKSCIRYGYFRQALVYMQLAGAKDFVFIFITKSTPHKIFYINVRDYPKEVAEAREELKFLLHFWTRFGMPEPIKPHAKTEAPKEAAKPKRTGRSAIPKKVRRNKNARPRGAPAKVQRQKK
jgi:hypothetical protein